MQQSDTSSVTSKSSEKRRRPFFPLVKKSSTEIVLSFDPRNLENRETKEEGKKGAPPRMMDSMDDSNLFFYHTYKSSKLTEEDTISIRNKDGRILVQGERTDLKTHYYAFVRDCNCNKPCESKKCRHPVYFVYKIKGVYDGKALSCRESDLIRRSERDSSSVEIKDEFNATDLLLKQMENNPLKDQLKREFKQIDEGYEGDQDEMSFKKSRKRTKTDDDENDDNKMMKMDDDDVNPNDEVDAGQFSDDSDHGQDDAPDKREVDVDIWDGNADSDDDDGDDDKDNKNKNGVIENLSESESESESESSEMEEEEEEDVDNGDLEKKQFGNILRDLFRRNGNKIRINQMHAQILNAMGNNRPLVEWYQHYSTQVKSVFDNLCKRNDQSGFYEFRG